MAWIMESRRELKGRFTAKQGQYPKVIKRVGKSPPQYMNEGEEE